MNRFVIAAWNRKQFSILKKEINEKIQIQPLSYYKLTIQYIRATMRTKERMKITRRRQWPNKLKPLVWTFSAFMIKFHLLLLLLTCFFLHQPNEMNRWGLCSFVSKVMFCRETCVQSLIPSIIHQFRYFYLCLVMSIDIPVVLWQRPTLPLELEYVSHFILKWK